MPRETGTLRCSSAAGVAPGSRGHSDAGRRAGLQRLAWVGTCNSKVHSPAARSATSLCVCLSAALLYMGSFAKLSWTFWLR